MAARKHLAAVLTALPILLAACASGYQQFYKAAPGATPEAVAALRASPAPQMPSVERAAPGDSRAILDAYLKRGYVMIGNSMFNSGNAESDDAAVRQGQAVGADLVLLLNPRYTGSQTTAIPLTTPTTTRSYSSGTATAYGSGGSVTAYGSGTTTTYGSTTSYVPMTVHRTDYGAVYFVKQRFGLGTFTRDLSDSERQELQTNRGAVVRVVVDNTPAFFADILVGDMIVSLDDQPITNAQHFNSMLRERRGRPVKITLQRRGQKIDKTVQLAL